MSVHDFSCKNNCNSLIIDEAINAVQQHRSFYVNRVQGSVAARENYIYVTYHATGYFPVASLWIQVIMKDLRSVKMYWINVFTEI